MTEPGPYDHVSDEDVRKLLHDLLDERRNGAASAIYMHFKEQLDADHLKWVKMPGKEWQSHWRFLAGDMLETAQALIDGGLTLWRKDNANKRRPRTFWRRQPQDQDMQLVFLVRYAQQLLRLWVETEFYRVRAFENHNAASLDPQARTAENVVQEITDSLQTYHDQIAQWRRHLRSATGKDFFRNSLGNAAQLREWRHQFGIDVTRGEVGYDISAPAIDRELRLQYYRALRRERATLGGKFGTFTVELTLRPGRFALLVGVMILSFAALYGGNSYVSGCRDVPTSGEQWAAFFGQSIFQAITNLVSLGSYDKPCGVVTPWLLSAESVLGYFILAILASSFFQQLQDE